MYTVTCKPCEIMEDGTWSGKGKPREPATEWEWYGEWIAVFDHSKQDWPSPDVLADAHGSEICVEARPL